MARQGKRRGRKSAPAAHFSDLPRYLRIAESYHKAKGRYLYAKSSKGKERKVLDLTGGNGTVLLGHNPPHLLALVQKTLKTAPALAVPMAERKSAEELSNRLSKLIEEETGRPYVTTLTSSSSEAIELALHQIELERRQRIEEIEKDRQKNLVIVRRQLKAQRIRPSANFLRDVATFLKIEAIRTVDDAIFELIRYAKEVARRPGLVMSLTNAYHGRTTGALAVSFDPREGAAYARYGLRSEFLNVDDVARLHERMKRSIEVWYDIEIDEKGFIHCVARPFINIAAILVEPVLLEGGVKIVPPEFMEALRQAADKIGCPLVIDESRCGLGWTGEVLASKTMGAIGDYYVLGGTLSAGLCKIAALLVAEERYVPWSVRTPATTQAGDEVSCAVALKVIDEIEEANKSEDGLFQSVARSGEKLLEMLCEVVKENEDIYRGVRGSGHLLGLTLRFLPDSPSAGVRAFCEQNLLAPTVAGHLIHEENIRLLPCVGAPHTLRIQAPAGLTDKEIDKFKKALGRVAQYIRKGNFGALTKYLVGSEGGKRSKKSYGIPLIPFQAHPHARKVAFLGHIISAETFPGWDRSVAEIPLEKRDEFSEIMQRILRPMFTWRLNVRSATGEIVTLCFFGMLITSKQIVHSYAKRDTAWLVERVFQAIDLAVQQGCSVIGFGGFSAVLTKNCRDIIDDRIATTSGISFTVVAGLEAIAKACHDKGIEMAKATVAAVGAYTDLCRNYAAVLAEDVQKLVLIGPKERQERNEAVAAEIYFQAFKTIYNYEQKLAGAKSDSAEGLNGKARLTGIAKHIANTKTIKELLKKPFPAQGTPASVGPTILQGLRQELGGDKYITFANDLEIIKECDVIVSGAPRGRMVVEAKHLKNGPVVICDIALPPSVHPKLTEERPDVPLLMGGLVRLPNNPGFFVPGIPLDNGTTFGCMAETMLLGLTGIMEHYSVGQLTQIKIKKIKEIAAIHGFELGYSKTIPSM